MIQTIASSQGLRSRTIGVVYLVYFLTAIFGAILTPSVANDVLAHEALFRLGFAISLISTALYLVVIALFYGLFRPVDRRVALFAALFGVVGVAITAIASVFQLAPFVVLSGGHYTSLFSAEQLQALVRMVNELYVQGNYIALVFFGGFDIAIGYLIWRSTFLPRVLGALMVLAGFAWLVFLSPPIAIKLLAPIEVVGFVAEAALMLWLLVRGVQET